MAHGSITAHIIAGVALSPLRMRLFGWLIELSARVLRLTDVEISVKTNSDGMAILARFPIKIEVRSVA